jgi:hypothetical protein
VFRIPQRAKTTAPRPLPRSYEGHIRHRYLSSLITLYKVKIIIYYFHSIEILTKNTNLDTIITTDEELYNLTIIGVYITIDLDTEAY